MESTHSTPRSEARGYAPRPERSTELTPKARVEGSGLILHFDELSILSLSKEAAL